MSIVAQVGVFGGERFGYNSPKMSFLMHQPYLDSCSSFTVLVGKAEVEKQSTITDGN
jgi:hypothetical protein